MGPAKGKALDKNNAADALLDQIEKFKAGVGAKVGHPFRIIKRQFGYLKTRYRALKKKTAQPTTVCAIKSVEGAGQAAGEPTVFGMSASENRRTRSTPPYRYFSPVCTPQTR